ncbi:MAG: type II toxin-antitoxin system mRNA interferase toxin, RelE/StbE family [Candidatus Liptonbacteria bacterium]|nr:type II toxin-antitoxin system mRNA interferase toxin, RelE/StbE family [Parcubacteria group bacterium]MBI4087325.1 type II toxin-antitoxin system mRNA interferase toxin, RelE/StbE family [Candidatus Liptonbacteria bacterium]
MVRVYYADNFFKRVKILTEKQQTKLARLIVLLKENPYHPQLHTKSLSGEFAGIYAFRITRDFRALFRFLSPDEIILVDVGDRKDVYR